MKAYDGYTRKHIGCYVIKTTENGTYLHRNMRNILIFSNRLSAYAYIDAKNLNRKFFRIEMIE